MADVATLITQIIVAVGGVAGMTALLTVRAQKRKLIAESGRTDAEADNALSEAYYRRASTQVSLVEPYERVMDRMQEELDEALERIDRLTARVEQLIDTIEAAGLPVPPAPPRDPPAQRRRR